jgi:hypothetical protein
MAYQHLKQQKILRAGITVIERLVAAARAQAHHESLHCLRPLLTSERTVLLDGLLLPDQDTGKTPLQDPVTERMQRGNTHMLGAVEIEAV